MEGLKAYCEQTSLHGWYYISVHGGKTAWRIVWTAIVLTSVVVASYFIYKAAEDFTKSTVVTTIHSTTEPLSEVYFPAVTVCNINQVRKSFFNDINIHNNVTLVDLLYQQFYSGSKYPPTLENQETIRRLFTSEAYVKSEYQYHRITNKGNVDEKQIHENWTSYLEQFKPYIEQGFQFTRLAVQEPYGVMVLKASYGTESRFGDSVNSSDFNPYFGTDYGICSLIKPQLAFNRSLDQVPYWKKIFGDHNWDVLKGAEVGKANGLSMLLDAETFDYTFHLKAGEGFKIAVHHHLDQPIMSIKELDISPGSVFQIAVTPTLMSTTPDAVARFTPSDRGCYVKGELPLKYLPAKFYRYEMSNCLFEAAYETILKRCNCTPSFHQLAYQEYPDICRGPGLSCMNEILRFIGKLNKVGTNQQECLAACEDQINNVGVTSSDFPNRETFVKRDEFCITLRKLNRTCNSEKREFLIAKFPTVCDNIITVNKKVEAANGTLCERLKWIPVRKWGLSKYDEDIKRLEETIFMYAKKNLAVVNVYIKDPVVTRIMRDEKIPIISFVANTGGLLGLCMGFSLVSVFEIMFHCGGALRKELVRRKRQQSSHHADCDDDKHGVVNNHVNKRSFDEQKECFAVHEVENNEEINAVSSMPKSTSNSNVNLRNNCCNSHNSRAKEEQTMHEMKTLNMMEAAGNNVKRNTSRKKFNSKNYLNSKNNPPNGTTIGVGNPLMVDAATVSPPSKYVPEECSSIRVVANYREENGQKYVVTPLLSYSNYNHICCNNGQHTSERSYISKSLSNLDRTLNKNSCGSFIEESYENPLQNTVTSFVFSKCDHNTSTKYTTPRRAFHKMNVDNYDDDEEEPRRGSNHYLDLDEVKSDACHSELHQNLIPKSETLSEMEGISKCSSNSHSLSPITGRERLL